MIKLNLTASKAEGIITVRCSDISPGMKHTSLPTASPAPAVPPDRIVTTRIPHRLAYIVEEITKRPITKSPSILNMFNYPRTTARSANGADGTNSENPDHLLRYDTGLHPNMSII